MGLKQWKVAEDEVRELKKQMGKKTLSVTMENH